MPVWIARIVYQIVSRVGFTVKQWIGTSLGGFVAYISGLWAEATGLKAWVDNKLYEFEQWLEITWYHPVNDFYGLTAIIQNIVIDEVKNETGFVLDRDNPLSAASIQNALNTRFGLTLTDIKNVQTTQNELVNDGINLSIHAQLVARGIIQSNPYQGGIDKEQAELWIGSIIANALELALDREGITVSIGNIFPCDELLERISEIAADIVLQYVIQFAEEAQASLTTEP